MPTYFHSWRRKLGVVTLVMACVFMAEWVRSLNFSDALIYQVSNVEEIDLISFQSALYLWNQSPSPTSKTVRIVSNGPFPIHWISHRLPKAGLVLSSSDLRWDWRLLGFGVCEFHSSADRMRAHAIPYWSIVIPLTLLSAWLLLSKPRKSPA